MQFFAFLAMILLAKCDDKRSMGSKETVILVSMDGMRWQYTDSGTFAKTPNLDSIVSDGVTAKYIKTVVPSKTWPNHHSYLTGLYAENHGIVSNSFFDPLFNETFVLDYDCSNYDPKFYRSAEPIWLTLQKQGGYSAVYFWPGFGGYHEKPFYYEKPICKVNCSSIDPKELPNMRNRTGSGWPPYVHCMVNHSEPVQRRIDKIMSWLKSKNPPQFVALYVEKPDSTGHGSGITDPRYREAMEGVDRDVVGYLKESLKEADLFDKVNLMFVSDHSMTDTSSNRQIFLEDLLNLADVYPVELGPVGHIWVHGGKEDEVFQNLTRTKDPRMKVYKKEDIPEEYHWKRNRRIPPIFIDPKVGWVLTKSRASARQGNWTVGDHGWPAPESKSWSVFFARGPAFRKGLEMSPFNTVVMTL